MTYREAQDAFESIPQFSTTSTLSRINSILDTLNRPEQQLKIVHVAGTNGKGSTSTMTARVLEEHGYKTGLFLSPYVVTFRERISINGTPISEADFARLAEELLQIAEVMPDRPNFFELTTALALRYFSEENCDFVVLEVGMGGRLDATNAIPAPLVSVITPIALDHTAYLGDTTGKIAQEKCGIIKPGSIVVSASSQPEDATQVIHSTCKETKVPLYVAPKPQSVSCSLDETCFSHQGNLYHLKLLGPHQAENACTVLTVCEALKSQGVPLQDALCASGIAKAQLPARLELLSRNPFCLLDGSHNPAGIRALFTFLDTIPRTGKLITVFGCLKDKGFPEMCEIVSKKSNEMIITGCPSPRTAEFSDLIPYLTSQAVHDCPNPTEALKKAFALASHEDLIVICGSLYLAGSIKQLLIRQDI